jgi:hypothetical protein
MTTTIDSSLEKHCRFALRFLLVLFVFSLILMGIFGWRLPAYVPLFFSRPFGLKQLAPFWAVYFYPVALLLLYFSSWWAHRKVSANNISLAVFLWVSLVASLLLTLSLLYVLFLVF